MATKTGLFEVLSSDATSSVHGDADSIQTTHLKEAWLKDVRSQEVRQVRLENSEVPLIAGGRIGLTFLHNKQLIAFKRSPDIPVEVVGRLARWNPVILAVLFSLPVIGYLAGMVWGLYGLCTGYSVMGRRFYRIGASRVCGLVLLFLSSIAWVQTKTLSDMISYHVTLAILLLIVLIVSKFLIARAEERYVARASAELNEIWRFAGA